MSDNRLKIYSLYDYDREHELFEARINTPCVDDRFLLEPLDVSTFQLRFSGYGATDEEATASLIEKLESNAKTLQEIADILKKIKPKV